MIIINSIKILHTGDLHLGSIIHNLGEKASSRSTELTETFSNIIDIAKRENVDAVLIAGDLFDTGSPDAVLTDYVYSVLKSAEPIKVFISLGNHDYGINAGFPPNVYVFNNSVEKIELGCADIYGVSFNAEHCRCFDGYFRADESDRVNILLMHCDLNSGSPYNPINEDFIKNSNMDYIAMGHTHSHNGFKTAGGVVYSYCGIPEGRAFDECGEKGVIIADVYKGHCDGRFVSVCGRKFICLDVDISDCGDNFEIVKKVKLFLGGYENAYRVSLVGEKHTFTDEKFIKDFLEKEYYFIEVTDKSIEATDSGYSLKNLFMQKCDNEDAKRYGLTALRGEKVHID